MPKYAHCSLLIMQQSHIWYQKPDRIPIMSVTCSYLNKKTFHFTPWALFVGSCFLDQGQMHQWVRRCLPLSETEKKCNNIWCVLCQLVLTTFERTNLKWTEQQDIYRSSFWSVTNSKSIMESVTCNHPVGFWHPLVEINTSRRHGGAVSLLLYIREWMKRLLLFYFFLFFSLQQQQQCCFEKGNTTWCMESLPFCIKAPYAMPDFELVLFCKLCSSYLSTRTTFVLCISQPSVSTAPRLIPKSKRNMCMCFAMSLRNTSRQYIKPHKHVSATSFVLPEGVAKTLIARMVDYEAIVSFDTLLRIAKNWLQWWLHSMIGAIPRAKKGSCRDSNAGPLARLLRYPKRAIEC